MYSVHRPGFVLRRTATSVHHPSIFFFLHSHSHLASTRVGWWLKPTYRLGCFRVLPRFLNVCYATFWSFLRLAPACLPLLRSFQINCFSRPRVLLESPNQLYPVHPFVICLVVLFLVCAVPLPCLLQQISGSIWDVWACILLNTCTITFFCSSFPTRSFPNHESIGRQVAASLLTKKSTR